MPKYSFDLPWSYLIIRLIVLLMIYTGTILDQPKDSLLRHKSWLMCGIQSVVIQAGIPPHMLEIIM